MTLVLVDERSLRRAAMGSLLCEWAKARDLTIVDVDALVPLRIVAHADCRMCVFHVGSLRGEGRWNILAKVMHGLNRDRPIVVLSDDESPEENPLRVRRRPCGGICPPP